MTALLTDVLGALDALLKPGLCADYCPNGLQVEGRPRVDLLVSGVTASQALLNAAVAAGAHAVLVHHGYFWRGEDPCIVGIKRRRLGTLLSSDISLIGYHLPLDIHPEFGNNVQLARLLGIRPTGTMASAGGDEIGLTGELSTPVSGEVFARILEAKLGRAPVHVKASRKLLRSIAWCTGAGQGFIARAAELGVDAYLSGEISEPTAHVARETGLHYFAAGHHATERYGVRAVGDYLTRHLALEHRFIDIPNPA